jgi:orotidine-5'-phosphate decarboxylase
MPDLDTLEPIDRIILPLDGMNEVEALGMVDTMRAIGITQFKVGKSLINRGAGGAVARDIIASDGDVFWDNKDRDIANTMEDAAIAANELGVKMFNVFADAGVEKLKRVKGVEGSAVALAVTVLTDMDDADCRSIYQAAVETAVLRFAT